jgi:hypothetical protein
VAKQRHLNLADLHTVAANFYSEILPSLVYQAAVRKHETQVSSEIELRLLIVWICLELDSGKVGPIPIPGGKVLTPHNDLSDPVEPNLLTLIVQ